MEIDDTQNLDIIPLKRREERTREESSTRFICQIGYSIHKICRKQVQKLIPINIPSNLIRERRSIFFGFGLYVSIFIGIFFFFCSLFTLFSHSLFLSDLSFDFFVLAIEDIHTHSELARYFLEIKINLQLTREPHDDLETFFDEFLPADECRHIVLASSLPEIKINHRKGTRPQ